MVPLWMISLALWVATGFVCGWIAREEVYELGTRNDKAREV